MNQVKILDVCCRHGRTVKVTLTGPVGTGKSILLAEIKRHLREIGFECHSDNDDDHSTIVSKPEKTE